MNAEQTAEIRFFDLQSRIGRLRYLAYPIGLMLLFIPAGIIGVLLMMASTILGSLFLFAAYVVLLVLSFGFIVRRLHDMDMSGWWCLLMLIPLVNFIFTLVLLFKAGTIGDNRFGPSPPPNSTWIVVGAWTCVAFIPLAGILAALAIPAYQDFVARSQMSEGILLAGGGEAPVAEYFQANKAWPADLASVYPAAKESPAGRYVATVSGSASADGSAYGIIATMSETGVNRAIAGHAVEVWTTDNGASWHCGPASSNPVEPRYLTGSCRDENPSPP